MTAVLIALACAAVYGAGTALQHQAASEVSGADTGAGHLLLQLLRRPSWLVGLVLSGVAFLLHVAALSHGSLAVVQPIVVTTIVFAVFVRSALDRTLPDRQEVLWAVCTWVGLALFVGSVHSRTAHHVANDRTALLFFLGGAARRGGGGARGAAGGRPTPARLPAGSRCRGPVRDDCRTDQDDHLVRPDRHRTSRPPLVVVAGGAGGTQCLRAQPAGFPGSPAVGQRPGPQHRRRARRRGVRLHRVRRPPLHLPAAAGVSSCWAPP